MDARTYIMTALKKGLITEEQITRSCVRLYTTRFLLGLFDGSEYDSIPYEVVECEEHRKLAVTAAEKGIVLLKNDGILPLDKSRIKTIGVIGPNANSRRVLSGNYHGTSSHYVTVLDGIQKEAGETCRVLYSEGCHLYNWHGRMTGSQKRQLLQNTVILLFLCLAWMKPLREKSRMREMQVRQETRNLWSFLFASRSFWKQLQQLENQLSPY